MSSISPTNPYSSLPWPLQALDSSPSDGSTPSDPLQALYQAFSGGDTGDPLLAAAGSGDASSGTGAPPFSPDVMQALLSTQGAPSGSASSATMQSVFAKFDANGDGQISQSEFENAIGSNADKSKVDALFNKMDANGDGSISENEMQTAVQTAHGHHHHHMHHGVGGAGQGGNPLQSLLDSASADGATSQSSTAADGSTTTTLTYADGTRIEMTTPAASQSDSGSSTSSQQFSLANWLKQLISLQAQIAPPTTSLTV